MYIYMRRFPEVDRVNNYISLYRLALDHWSSIGSSYYSTSLSLFVFIFLVILVFSLYGVYNGMPSCLCLFGAL